MEPSESEKALCIFLFRVYVTHRHFSTVHDRVFFYLLTDSLRKGRGSVTLLEHAAMCLVLPGIFTFFCCCYSSQGWKVTNYFDSSYYN